MSTASVASLGMVIAAYHLTLRHFVAQSRFVQPFALCTQVVSLGPWFVIELHLPVGIKHRPSGSLGTIHTRMRTLPILHQPKRFSLGPTHALLAGHNAQPASRFVISGSPIPPPGEQCQFRQASRRLS